MLRTIVLACSVGLLAGNPPPASPHSLDTPDSLDSLDSPDSSDSFDSAASDAASVPPRHASPRRRPGIADRANTTLAQPAPPSLTDGHVGPDRELIEWAVGRYAMVGIELPAIDILIDAEHERCPGVHGRFLADADGARIVLCLEHRDAPVIVFERRRTLLHELAHAWDHDRLGDADRERLRPVLEVETWYDHAPAWEERGVERFAETLVWGLLDQRRRPVLIDVPCAELHRDFVAITGHRALGPIEIVCELPG